MHYLSLNSNIMSKYYTINELRELIHNIITEATADEIKLKYYPNIKQDDFNKIVNSDKITSNLQNGKVGSYAKWLLKLYFNNKLRLEDLYKAEEYITIFDKLLKSNKLVNKDINSYNTLLDIYNVVKDYLGQDQAISKGDEYRKVKEQAKKIYEDGRFMVIQPLTEEASCYYGKGTQWCTGADISDNSFDFYNSQGPLYIIIDKSKRNSVGDYTKYQIQFESGEYLDENDNEINFEEHPDIRTLIFKLMNFNITELLKKNPSNIMLINNPSEAVQLEAVKKDGWVIRYIKNPSERVQLASVSQDHGGLDFIIHKGIIPSELVQLAAVRQNGAEIRWIKNPSEAVQLEAVKYYEYKKNKNISEQILRHIVKKLI